MEGVFLTELDIHCWAAALASDPHDVAPRVFVGFYWFYSVAAAAIFTGNLMALMAIKKYNIPVNTLHELSVRSEYQAGVVDGVALSDLFRVRFSCFQVLHVYVCAYARSPLS